MIEELTVNDRDIIKKVEEMFPSFFSKTSIINDFNQNAFTKYFIYIEKSNIISIVNYFDLIDRFELSYIEVKDNYRNKKIGSKMLEHLIEIGKDKNITNITLEVKIDNINALMLYKKYDFNIVAIRKGYYNGVDGYLMERKMM